MIQLIGLLITTASIAGLCVLIEGATDARRRLRAYVHARRAEPSREAPDPDDEGGQDASNEND